MFDLARGCVGLFVFQLQNLGEKLFEGRMPVTDHCGGLRPFGRQLHRAVRLVMDQPARRKRLQRIGDRRHFHAEPVGDIFGMRMPVALDDLGDRFEVIFQAAGNVTSAHPMIPFYIKEII